MPRRREDTAKVREEPRLYVARVFQPVLFLFWQTPPGACLQDGRRAILFERFDVVSNGIGVGRKDLGARRLSRDGFLFFENRTVTLRTSSVRERRLAKCAAVALVVGMAVGWWYWADVRDWYADAPRGAELLYCAVACGSVEDIDRALEQGATIDARNNAGDVTPLIVAADAQRPDLVRVLLERGADPNAEALAGVTPLYNAIVADDVEVIEMLVRAGADPNRLHRGETALDVAIRMEKANAIRVLRENSLALMRR